MNIRHGSIADAERIIPLFDQYRIFYGQESDLNLASQFLYDRFENEDSIFLIAEENSNCIGFARLFIVFSSVNLGAYFVLNDLFVSAANRKKGTATALIEKCKELCQNNDMTGLRLATQPENKAALALYAKQGFKKDADFNYYSWST